MPDRKWQSDKEGYRFSFNGKEDDTEWGAQDYGMRIYDKSIARFLSVDPLTKDYPWLTPYQFAANSPIWAVDIDGLEGDQNTDPANQSGANNTESNTLQEYVVTASRPVVAEPVKESWWNRFVEKVEKQCIKTTAFMKSAVKAFVGDMALIPPSITVYDYSDNPEIAEQERQGAIAGHTIAIAVSVAEIDGGSTMAGGGVVVTGTGVGAVAGVPVIIVGTGIALHGTSVISVATTNLVKMQVEETNNAAHNDDDDYDYAKNGKSKEDKMRGGKKKDRDRNLARYGGAFEKWFHQYKQKMKKGSRKDASDEELKELYELWEKLGKPSKFHPGQLE